MRDFACCNPHRQKKTMSCEGREKHRYPGDFIYKGVTYLPYVNVDYLKRIEEEDLPLGKDAIFVVSYPKSGTTWTLELTYWLLRGCKAGETRTASFHDEFPEFEMAIMHGPGTLERLHAMPRPLHFKSHLYAMFFKRYLDRPELCPKFVVVMRNVKDVIVSFYHFHLYFVMCGFKGYTFDDFFERFKNKTIYLGDPIDHMIGWWKYKDHPNVHIIFYEEMLQDTRRHIKTIGDFIGYPVNDEDTQRIQDGCSFGKMRDRDLGLYFAGKFHEGSTFFRKGQAGDWKNYMSEEQARYVDDLVKEKCHPLGLFV